MANARESRTLPDSTRKRTGKARPIRIISNHVQHCTWLGEPCAAPSGREESPWRTPGRGGVTTKPVPIFICRPSARSMKGVRGTIPGNSHSRATSGAPCDSRRSAPLFRPLGARGSGPSGGFGRQPNVARFRHPDAPLGFSATGRRLRSPRAGLGGAQRSRISVNNRCFPLEELSERFGETVDILLKCMLHYYPKWVADCIPLADATTLEERE